MSREQSVTTVVLEQLLDPPAGAGEPPVARATVQALEPLGTIVVRARERSLRCDFLECGLTAGLDLAVGDAVLVLMPEAPGQHGCVLGRVGRYRAQAAAPPRQLTIEAGERLTLKCGQSTVELRGDGKLAVRGTDVLTRAKRTNRIKGGTVAIN
jgi:hypothetical protein